MPRFQFQLRWLMIAVAIVAILLSLPTAAAVLVQLLGLILLMTLLPAGMASPGRRIEAAYWSLALHPVLLLSWLSLWRLTAFRQPLYPKDHSMLHRVILEAPYLMAASSLVYLPCFALLGWTTAAPSFPRRLVLNPLAYLPITWGITLFVLTWDPFELFDWVWD